MVIVIFFAFVFLVRSDQGKVKYYFPFVLLASPVLLVLHSVIPFVRTFEYFTCILALFSGILLSYLFKYSIIKKYLFVLIILIQILMANNSGREIFQDEKYSVVSEKEVAQLHSGNKFLCYSTLFGTYLKYYNSRNKGFLISDHIIPLNMVNMKAVRSMNDVDKYQSFAVNMDTISGHNYDYYIVDDQCDKTVNKMPISKSEFHTIYNN